MNGFTIPICLAGFDVAGFSADRAPETDWLGFGHRSRGLTNRIEETAPEYRHTNEDIGDRAELAGQHSAA